MAVAHTRVARTTWRGAPLLDVEPFSKWVREYMADKDLSKAELARLVKVDERRIRMWLGEQPTISEHTVEQVGIRLLQDPRLVAQLYPEYDF